MTFTAPDILAALVAAAPRPTCEAPRDAGGIYGLVDHEGQLRYIGSTGPEAGSFHKRIHQRHRTGPEDTGHCFSHMYNCGRMWRDPEDAGAAADGKVAKALRNAFIAEHCRAVWVALPGSLDITGLVEQVIAVAPPEAIAWNRRSTGPCAEPVALVDPTLAGLGLSARELASLKRQSPPYRRAPDVETANSDRASICQIGITCVREDGGMETWTSLVDPQTSDWSCSFVHGITARDVRGAPRFAEIFGMIDELLAGRTVYQHSSFDRSAVSAACAVAGLSAPDWDWQDSVRVAQRAWPALPAWLLFRGWCLSQPRRRDFIPVSSAAACSRSGRMGPRSASAPSRRRLPNCCDEDPEVTAAEPCRQLGHRFGRPLGAFALSITGPGHARCFGIAKVLQNLSTGAMC